MAIIDEKQPVFQPKVLKFNQSHSFMGNLKRLGYDSEERIYAMSSKWTPIGSEASHDAPTGTTSSGSQGPAEDPLIAAWNRVEPYIERPRHKQTTY